MAEQIKELEERGRTDIKLSFGLYFVFLIIVIGIGILTSFFSMLFAGLTTGIIISTVVMLLVAIYVWWYNWLLYKRRNEHFERIKKLKSRLCELVKEKLNEETADLMKVDPLVIKRERYHSKYLFFLWLIFSYLGNLTKFSTIFIIFTILAVVFGLIILYYLTVDFYYHEQGEISFFQKLGELLKKKGISFDTSISSPLPRRRYGLYIFLSIITLGIFGIYWAYILFRDPNQHFDTHVAWENQLRKIIQENLS